MGHPVTHLGHLERRSLQDSHGQDGLWCGDFRMRSREHVLEVALGGKTPAVSRGILHLFRCLDGHVAPFNRVLGLILVIHRVLNVHRVDVLVADGRRRLISLAFSLVQVSVVNDFNMHIRLALTDHELHC